MEDVPDNDEEVPEVYGSEVVEEYNDEVVPDDVPLDVPDEVPDDEVSVDPGQVKEDVRDEVSEELDREELERLEDIKVSDEEVSEELDREEMLDDVCSDDVIVLLDDDDGRVVKDDVVESEKTDEDVDDREEVCDGEEVCDDVGDESVVESKEEESLRLKIDPVLVTSPLVDDGEESVLVSSSLEDDRMIEAELIELAGDVDSSLVENGLIEVESEVELKELMIGHVDSPLLLVLSLRLVSSSLVTSLLVDGQAEAVSEVEISVELLALVFAAD